MDSGGGFQLFSGEPVHTQSIGGRFCYPILIHPNHLQGHFISRAEKQLLCLSERTGDKGFP